MNGRLIEILLVEDNPGDVRLTQEALKQGKMTNHMEVVHDGEEAMRYLRRKNKALPDLILLDLNLPVMSGHEVLAEIKEDPTLRTIPVIVLTTSNAEEDIIKTYELHGNCYIRKPVEMASFLTVVKQIESFWLGIVALPRVNER